jgi:hypothetical protein
VGGRGVEIVEVLIGGVVIGGVVIGGVVIGGVVIGGVEIVEVLIGGVVIGGGMRGVREGEVEVEREEIKLMIVIRIGVVIGEEVMGLGETYLQQGLFMQCNKNSLILEMIFALLKHLLHKVDFRTPQP